MGLEVYQGHKVQVVAHGPDAAQAAKELAEALREGLGEEGVVPVSEVAVPPPAAAAPPLAARREPARRSEDPNVLLGVAASPGLGVGRVLRVFHEDIEVKEDAADRHKERRLLNEALDRAMVQLEALENRLGSRTPTRTRPRSSPPTGRSCATRTCSTSPRARSTRARARPSPGGGPTPPTRTGSPA